MLKIGFMQGRLSPKPEDRIQAFPKDNWKQEFAAAPRAGFSCIELIYDELYLEENPLGSASGRGELRQLAEKHGVALHSICADYFMCQPLVAEGPRKGTIEKARELFSIAKEIGCPLVEFPFVDSTSLLKHKNLGAVHDVMASLARDAQALGITIAVETDLPPLPFRDFLNGLPDNVGANLDLGNSAALGYDVLAECRAYGHRLLNIHIKDRVLGGTTVPLTEGHTDFPRAFRGLKEAHYKGDFILQTAPSPDYIGAATRYRDFVAHCIEAL